MRNFSVYTFRRDPEGRLKNIRYLDDLHCHSIFAGFRFKPGDALVSSFSILESDPLHSWVNFVTHEDPKLRTAFREIKTGRTRFLVEANLDASFRVLTVAHQLLRWAWEAPELVERFMRERSWTLRRYPQNFLTNLAAWSMDNPYPHSQHTPFPIDGSSCFWSLQQFRLEEGVKVYDLNRNDVPTVGFTPDAR